MAVCGDKKMLQRLVDAPYWTRVWTLQEIAQPHVKLLCRNNDDIDLQSVFDGVETSPIRRTERPGFIYHEIFFRGRRPQKPRWYDYSSSKGLDLYHMGYFMSIKASDPRDKIYAMRSQFVGTFGKIKVDYNRSTWSVFADATKQIICETPEGPEKMVVLVNASRATALHDLPSWAVDWTSEDNTMRFWECGAPHIAFQATRESHPRYRFSEDLERLVLTGTMVGRVHERHIGPRLSKHFRPKGKHLGEDMTDNPETTKAVYEEIESWASDLTTAIEGNSHNNEPDALIHKSTLRSFLNLLKLMNQEQSKKVLKWTSRHSPPRIIKNIASDSWARSWFCTHLGTGRLFVTTDGHCGCGPWGLEPEDMICVFSGLQFPFVVRPRGSEYLLVGAAIVDGMMHGEMWPEDESQLTEWEFV